MEQQVTDIAVTALHPIQMQESQEALIAWCNKKIIAVTDEADELRLAYEHAKKNKWQTATLNRHYNLALKRQQYYIKIQTALVQGYYIVPNFPIQMFVIRTRKDRPKGQWKKNEYYINSATADVLELGTGEYHNPEVMVEKHHTWNAEKNQYDLTHVTADEFAETEFPINMAKPSIMDATSRAMAKKIFDQIGVLPSFRKNQDPLIIGQILGHNKIVSFMIAWHLNTDVI